MLKDLGMQLVQLDTIEVEKGFKARLKAPHVKELAESIKESGLLEPIIVRDSIGGKPRHIVAGRDRLAALMLNKNARYIVKMVQGSDIDCEIAMLEENLMRRRGDDYDAMISRLVDIRTEVAQASIEDARKDGLELLVEPTNKGKEPAKAEKAPKPKGRPKAAKTAAIEAVAKAVNKTPEAVRQSTKRHAVAEAAKAAPPVAISSKVETWDVELSAEVAANVVKVVHVQDELATALADIRRIQKRLKGFSSSSMVWDATYKRLDPKLEEVAESTKAAYLTALCPYCKGDLRLRVECTGCNTVGFIGPALLEHVPAELKAKGRSAKVPDGAGGFRLLRQTEIRVERDVVNGHDEVWAEDIF